MTTPRFNRLIATRPYLVIGGTWQLWAIVAAWIFFSSLSCAPDTVAGARVCPRADTIRITLDSTFHFDTTVSVCAR